ncbi:nuclear transport factor 2 family protein [Vitreoscilla massiliensis]|uniref:Nuclear transport factor 2 family protein n=1 Tax=Vitreoscilla massiliensis TaxID=1689272 RepID=A0ABY4E7A7_9NEIS|nr:nuclear transport factor 2 family protein [Vitreoscilla massiliensis]UOO89262.1 nuclear transport factor 2 family protein [Vitreoscilla massiliensis]
MDTKMIEDFEQQRFQALIMQDYDLFTSMCDKNLIYVHNSGNVDTLEGYYHKLVSGYYRYLSIDYEISHVEIFTECVLVFANLKAHILVNNEEKQLNNRLLSVLKRNHSGLKLLAQQPTPIR